MAKAKWLSPTTVEWVERYNQRGSKQASDYVVTRKICPALEHLRPHMVSHYGHYLEGKYFTANDSRIVLKLVYNSYEVTPERCRPFSFRSHHGRNIKVQQFDDVRVCTPTLVVIRDLRNTPQ